MEGGEVIEGVDAAVIAGMAGAEMEVGAGAGDDEAVDDPIDTGSVTEWEVFAIGVGDALGDAPGVCDVRGACDVLGACPTLGDEDCGCVAGVICGMARVIARPSTVIF